MKYSSLVPWNLLQRLFYCFSCSLIGQSWIISEVEWNVVFRHFSRHICSTVAETIGVTNYAASFGAKKCSENQIWSYWDDARSAESTIRFCHFSCYKYSSAYVFIKMWYISRYTGLTTSFSQSAVSGWKWYFVGCSFSNGRSSTVITKRWEYFLSHYRLHVWVTIQKTKEKEKQK